MSTLTDICQAMQAVETANLTGLHTAYEGVPDGIDGNYPATLRFVMQPGEFHHMTVAGNAAGGGTWKERQRIHYIGVVLLIAARDDPAGLNALELEARKWVDKLDDVYCAHSQMNGTCFSCEIQTYELTTWSLQDSQHFGVLFKVRAETWASVTVAQ